MSDDDVPIVYSIAREGTATLSLDEPGTDLQPLFEAIVGHVPAPSHQPDHPLQAWVTNLDASPYVGRLAICRIVNGEIRKGSTVAWCRV